MSFRPFGPAVSCILISVCKFWCRASLWWQGTSWSIAPIRRQTSINGPTHGCRHGQTSVVFYRPSARSQSHVGLHDAFERHQNSDGLAAALWGSSGEESHKRRRSPEKISRSYVQICSFWLKNQHIITKLSSQVSSSTEQNFVWGKSSGGRICDWGHVPLATLCIPPLSRNIAIYGFNPRSGKERYRISWTIRTRHAWVAWLDESCEQLSAFVRCFMALQMEYFRADRLSRFFTSFVLLISRERVQNRRVRVSSSSSS